MHNSTPKTLLTPCDITKDLRAAATEQKRFRTRQNKYYSFRGVKPGQLNHPHYVGNSSPIPWPIPALHSELPVKHMTKQELYQEAQEWPRPPKYQIGRSERKTYGYGWTSAYDKKKAVRKSLGRELQEWHMKGYNDDCVDQDVEMAVSDDWYDIWWVWHPEHYEDYAEFWEDKCVWEDLSYARGQKDADEFNGVAADVGDRLEQETGKENNDEGEADQWVLFNFTDDVSDCGTDFELV